MRRLLLLSNGCEQRMLDMEYFKHCALANGDLVVTDRPDIILYVSCCVSVFARATAFREIVRYCSMRLPVIVFGCLPRVDISQFSVKTIAYYSVQQRAQLLAHMGWTISVPYPVLTAQDQPLFSLFGRTPRTQFSCAKRGKKIVICDGCLSECSYCIIRFATGRLKSKSISEIVSIWRENVRPGDHVMLMGGDVGAYGMDIGTNLPHLLVALHAENIPASLFLHDLNIRWMRKYLDAFCRFVSSNHFVRGLTLPIQSGNNAILESMKRHYTVDDIIDCFQKIRKANSQLLLGTHIIIGFPGETNQHFSETAKLLKCLPLDFLSCFPYSEHKEADSAQLNCKVAPHTIQERIKYLTKMFGDRLSVYA